MMTPTIDDVAREFDSRYGIDPCGWARDGAGVELWSRQRDILDSTFRHRRTVVPSGHGVGKTFVAAVAVLTFLFLRRPSKVITTAPTWRQVETVLWSEIASRVAGLQTRFGETGIEALTARLRISPEHFAIGISSDKPENLQGYHAPYVLVVFDEAAGIESLDTWRALDSLTSTGDAHVLAIGNPSSSSGAFYDACRSPEWTRIAVSCLDSPNFTDEPVSKALRDRLVSRTWVEEKRREWGEDSPMWQSRVLGQFPTEGDDVLIPLAWAESATRREVTNHLTPRVLGVDVARFGSDKTVYMGLFGDMVKLLAVDAGKDTMQVCGRVQTLIGAHGIETVAIDDVGVGGGVTDRLRETGSCARIVAVNTGETAIEPARFPNRRSELWWVLREWVRDTGQIPNEGNLLADLTAPRFTYTSRGQIKVEAKDETRKRLGRSPDYADGVMLALAGSAQSNLDWFGKVDWGDARPIARAFPG